MNCPTCGRFSRETGTKEYYDGNWNQIDVYVECSQCGENVVQCV